MPINEAKTLYGIFDSYKDIANPNEVYDTTIRKLNDRWEDSKRENERLKQEHKENLLRQEVDAEARIKALERDLFEAKILIDDLKREQAIKVEQIKETRDQQSHKQKQNFEIVKFVISMITMVVGLIPLCLKVFSTTA